MFDPSPVRVLVVDDSALMRKAIRDAVSSLPGYAVVGTAPNGQLALEQLTNLKPDAITLDLHMPHLDGLGFLRAQNAIGDTTPVVMLSAHTPAGADQTLEALHLGAVDFVLKPETSDPHKSHQQLCNSLAEKLVVAVNIGRRRSRTLTLSQPHKGPGGPVPKVVGIGVSTGGPQALCEVIPRLPHDLPVPVCVVQHMPPKFTKSLAADLDRRSDVRVEEACDGDALQAGCVYVAPGGRQMCVREGPGAHGSLEINEDPPTKNCRPSVDYLFRSLDVVYGARALGVILTGMGDDGADGCERLRASGASVIAQNEASSVVYGMPRSVVERGLATEVLPLAGIAAAITSRLNTVPLQPG